MSTLQLERSLQWRQGHVQASLASSELPVYFGTRRLRPGNFGLLIPELAIADDGFEEFVASVDAQRGPLTPEQLSYAEWVNGQDFAQNAASEYNLEADKLQLALRRTLEIFIRAYPLVCYFRFDVNPYYDGFYGGMDDYQLPIDLAYTSTRAFIASTFGEYRRPFVRAMLEASVPLAVHYCTLAGALRDSDLMCRILDASHELSLPDFEEKIYFSLFLVEMADLIRPQTLWNLIHSPLKGLPRAQSISQQASPENLYSVRAKTWVEFADKLVRLPVSKNTRWPKHPRANELEAIEIAGYQLEQVLDTQSMMNLSVESDNCLYSIQETTKAQNGVGYFKVTLDDITVGTLSVDEYESGYSVIALGVDNVELPNGAELKETTRLILENRENNE